MNRSIAALGWGTAFLLFALSAGATPESVAVHDPWIAETPPGATVAAGYFVLENKGDETLTVTAAESPACERIEFHRIEMEGDIARMRPQESLIVPAGEKLTLASDGMHLMLFRPLKLTAGQRIPIRLILADGGTIEIDAVVRALGHSAHEHHAH